MHTEVIIESEGGATRTEVLHGAGPFSIGRHAQSAIYLDSDLVSRLHALVRVEASSLVVQDVSTNGTMAGGSILRHREMEIPYGAPIGVGAFKLYFRPSDGPSPLTALSTASPATPRSSLMDSTARGGASGGARAGTVVMPSAPAGMGLPVASGAPAGMAGAPAGMAGAPAGMPVAKAGAGMPVAPVGCAPVPVVQLSAGMPVGMAAAPAGVGMAAAPVGAGMAAAPVRVGMAAAPVGAGLPAAPVAAGMPAPMAAVGMHGPTGSVGGATPSRFPPIAPGALEFESDRQADANLRREIHRLLLEHLDLVQTDAARLDDPSFRPRVLIALRRIVCGMTDRLPPGTEVDRLIGEMADEALGLGPLEHLLSDPTITEIMVIDANTIYVEKEGRLERSRARFTDDERVRAVIERIITPLGRRIDESSPLVDARLKDGSRVNAIIRPLALRGSCITIRKFAKIPLTLEKLISLQALSPEMARFLTRSVISKKNIVISGGTGSGKTTLLNVLSAAIPMGERIITIEDAAELQLAQPHVVALETRPANMEGKGQYTIRDLVRNALRMRPDRIVVGECRGGEALDMLQAMNTGHDGSLTTTHANSPEEAATRLETLALMAGLDLPQRAIRDQIAKSVNLIVQQSRLSDGTRKITAISEVCGIDENGEVDMRPIFEFYRTGTGPSGQVLGGFRTTGYLPTFLSDFLVRGLIKPGERYL